MANISRRENRTNMMEPTADKVGKKMSHKKYGRPYCVHTSRAFWYLSTVRTRTVHLNTDFHQVEDILQCVESLVI